MIMNNKQIKQLYDITGEYWDKTLSFGCIVKTYNAHKIITADKKKYQYWLELYPQNFKERFHSYLQVKDGVIKEGSGEFITECGTEILGHLDITAVLKYINKFPGDSNKHTEGLNRCFIFMDTLSYVDETAHIVFEIPNKPLHLYTEQEADDLIKLLKEIGKK